MNTPRGLLFTLAVTLAGLAAEPLQAQSFPVDASYGTAGLARAFSAADADHDVTAQALDSQGNWLIATMSSVNRVATLTRYTVGGQRDTSFGVDGTVYLNLATRNSSDRDEIRKVQPLAGGGVLLATSQSLIKLTSGGQLDSSYAQGGRLTSTTPLSAATLSDTGRAMLLNWSTGTGPATLRMERVESDGRAVMQAVSISVPISGVTKLDRAESVGNDWLLLVSDASNTSPTMALKVVTARSDVNGFLNSSTLQTNEAPSTDGTAKGSFARSFAFDSTYWFWVGGVSSVYESSAQVHYVFRTARSTGTSSALENSRTLSREVDGSRTPNRLSPRLASLTADAGRVILARTEDTPGPQTPVLTSNLSAYFASDGQQDFPFSAPPFNGHVVALTSDAQANIRTVSRQIKTHFCFGALSCRSDFNLQLSRFANGGGALSRIGSIEDATPRQASNDIIDSMVASSDGGIIFAGIGLDTYTFPEYMAWKLVANGQPDPAFGVQGRSDLASFPRCSGKMRADRVSGNPMWVVVQNSGSSFCTISSLGAWQVRPDGTHVSYSISGLPAQANGIVDVAALADSGALIAAATTTAVSGTVILQRLTGTGSVNEAFGTRGTLTLDTPGPLASGINAAPSVALSRLATGEVAVASNGPDQVYLTKFSPEATSSAGIVWQSVGGLPTFKPFETSRLRANASGDSWALLTNPDGHALMHARLLNSPQSPALQYFPVGAVDLVVLADGSAVVLRVADNFGYELVRVARQGASLVTLSSQTFTGPDGRSFAKPTSLHLQENSNGAKVVVAAYDGEGNFLRRHSVSTAVTLPTGASVVEYYNTSLRHYFVTASTGEQRSIETGGAGPGWQRLNVIFKAYDAPISIGALSTTPVCRFYGKPNVGPNSHFYTFEGSECDAVKRDPGWQYEGIAFHLIKPTATGCPSGTSAVYRSYNNGFARNDSNHRYYSDASIAATMQAQGWSAEGVVFCSPQ